MKIRYILLSTSLLICAFAMQSCGGESPYEFLHANAEPDPHELPVTAEDSANIETFYVTLNNCYDNVIADTAVLDSGACNLTGLSRDQMFVFRLEELGSIFDPDTMFSVSEKYHLADIQPWFFIDDLKNRNYNQLFAEHIAAIEQTNTILILESVIRMEPKTTEEGFDSGLFVGYFHVLNLTTGQRQCAKVITAENSEYITVMDNDSHEAITGQLTSDLNDQTLMALQDTFSNIYNLN